MSEQRGATSRIVERHRLGECSADDVINYLCARFRVHAERLIHRYEQLRDRGGYIDYAVDDALLRVRNYMQTHTINSGKAFWSIATTQLCRELGRLAEQLRRRYRTHRSTDFGKEESWEPSYDHVEHLVGLDFWVHVDKLQPTEQAVVRLLAFGRTPEEIATELGYTVRWVRELKGQAVQELVDMMGLAHPEHPASSEDQRKAVEAMIEESPESEVPQKQHSPWKAGDELVPRYSHRLVKKLEEGTFGEVWRAECANGRPVALKFLHLDRLTTAVEQRALEIIKRIDHPNVLTIHNYWEDNGWLVISTPLAERSLADRHRELQAGGRQDIPQRELSKYLDQIATALDYLAEKRIQHGDVKPSNVLLQGEHVLLGDFGLAQILRGPIADAPFSGTETYAAPERFAGKVSQWSDQYSLAVTYYVLRTGRYPYPEGDRTRSAEPDWTKFTSGERDIVARALRLDPTTRWRDCTAFVSRLPRLDDEAGYRKPVRFIRWFSFSPATRPAPDKDVDPWALLESSVRAEFRRDIIVLLLLKLRRKRFIDDRYEIHGLVEHMSRYLQGAGLGLLEPDSTNDPIIRQPAGCYEDMLYDIKRLADELEEQREGYAFIHSGSGSRMLSKFPKESVQRLYDRLETPLEVREHEARIATSLGVDLAILQEAYRRVVGTYLETGPIGDDIEGGY